MRRIKLDLYKETTTGWEGAIGLTAGYLTENLKANQLLDRLPATFVGQRRALCQSLFLGALRNGHKIRAIMQPFFRKKPKPMIEAILLVAGYEILSSDFDKGPKIVHHAVEQAKKIVAKAEIGFLNAVLRKLPDALQASTQNETPLPTRYSHPNWLVKRWINEFGQANTEALLIWNQQTPSTYFKNYTEQPLENNLFLKAKWPDFYTIAPKANWQSDVLPKLNQGTAYIKDPSTRLASNLMNAQPGETILDLCAAPGGKAFDLAHSMKQNGHIVAVDLLGNRIGKLRQNLDSLQHNTLQTDILEIDVLQLTSEDLRAAKLPLEYDAVMLDAPCSNTGVIQRRTDVKWRLTKKDINQCTALQNKLVQAAASFVLPGGRLIYSTCSIETAENRSVIDTFLKSERGIEFTLEDSEISYPWKTGHDGAGAFRLRRKECS